MECDISCKSQQDIIMNACVVFVQLLLGCLLHGVPKKHVFLKLHPTKGSRYAIYAGNTMAWPFCSLMDLSD